MNGPRPEFFRNSYQVFRYFRTHKTLTPSSFLRFFLRILPTQLGKDIEKQ